ncbi:MAG: RidA family protein [Phycisphaerales bacterium]|nr:MAG: RidA family protein [Phycisphaerales bacterium]
MQVRRAFTAAPWEKEVGYCRAIRAGDHIYITGTAPVDDDGGVHAPGDAYAQARRCLEIIEKALQELGATLANVVRTRMFVTDITRWAEFGRAHREFFADHPPATSMVEVKSLIDPAMLIEIEADAVVPLSDHGGGEPGDARPRT